MRLGKAQEIVDEADAALIKILEDPSKIHDPERAHVELDETLMEMIRKLSEYDGTTSLARVVSRAEEIVKRCTEDHSWWASA